MAVPDQQAGPDECGPADPKDDRDRDREREGHLGSSVRESTKRCR
ncbi:MAG: hypothetical protein QXG03_03290 [Halalkalicoccus sp.]